MPTGIPNGTTAQGELLPGRAVRPRDFVRLKLRLLRNGFRGQTWRIVLYIFGALFGLWMGFVAFAGIATTGLRHGEHARDFAFLVAALGGAAVIFAWTLFPLLFFGVDETIDPARFNLLPLPRRTLIRGMLAAAFVGIPAVATLLATSGFVVAAGLRFGGLPAVAAAFGVAAGLVMGVVASRAVTSAFATMLRSRRMRDLAAVLIAIGASLIGPLQWLGVAVLANGSVSQAMGVARVISWTPLGAPYVLPFDVAEGQWGAFVLRVAITAGTIAVLLWWWSATLESAMIGTTSAGAGRAVRSRRSGGATAALVPWWMPRFAARGTFGAIMSREWLSWWRDARRRASLVSVLIASGVLPIALRFAGGVAGAGGQLGVSLVFAVTMAGTMGGMMLGNQFAFDGNAYAAHLMTRVPGRTELRARAAALAVVALPVQALVAVAVMLVSHSPAQIPAALGVLVTGFGAAIATASYLSILAAYPLPDVSNPFALNTGAGSAKGLLALVAMLGTLVLSTPVTVASLFLTSPTGAWLILVLGIGYGAVAALLGTYLAGDVLERRGPELLVAITPRR
jgi:ABC-2 type transport system permease protein